MCEAANAAISLQIRAHEPIFSGVRQNARSDLKGAVLMPLTPEVLTANSQVVARLGSLDISFTPDDESWFTIDGIEGPRQVGSDGSGGAFVLLPSQNVLYVSSEGRAGIIAGTFEAFIQLVVVRPYWLDILKFSAGGDLAEMRRAADALEATLDDEDEVNEAREQIRKGLDLPEPDDPVGALYEAVAASDAIVRTTDGSPFTTLFNRFSIDNNPMLRNAAA
ncbi:MULTISPECIES: hypothetical protein [Bradyrhizobium]|nr:MULTISPECIES: hypothetical protein [Bradyrhizobium]MBP1061646.1 hypothetical protein [Bradyrhizobium japonicum]PDT58931.1 hypothetical protein CO678_24425 [Bradyrhizobium diazoefficiens]QHP66238.1 hypothetical protein EI171_01655 [Bradyrhizobium sp. LCT2]WLA74846.1 hypothetical protein QIH77_06525 [Bradyrhizobium diazoefficiens]